ncbi:MAG: 16S rRNA (cytidine(1402)-2'-O)-methyltransferase [Clostridium sp.]|nr:16S rRNA (cytidine(1402)-2'-O)-methyltransferase [Clostridium sp.]
MIQKSYENSEYGKLYLIPTPIGNLDDITLRAIKTLEMVDIVYAEDTRETLNLLKYLKINKKVESCHKYTEMKHKDKIVQILKLGKNIGYVTDRGTPLISDPGNVIVDESIKQNITVIALPGPNALLPAINMSGLSNERFLFYGFLNSKQSLAKKELIDLKDIKQTIIFYESPHRITDTLSQILDVFGNRNIAIVREISKLHEEVIRDNIENILKITDTLKGEMVIIVEGNTNEETLEVNYTEEIDKLLTQGYSKRDAIREIADKYNVSKNKLYNEFKES